MNMGLMVAIAGGGVLVLAAGVAFVFWNRRRSAGEEIAAPPPMEIKPIVPKVARPRPGSARPGNAQPSDENLLQYGAVGKMNVPSKRPTPQVPATAPPLPTPQPEASKAPAPSAPAPEAPPKLPSSSAAPSGGMPTVPAGLTSSAAKPLSLVPDLAPAAPPVSAAAAPVVAAATGIVLADAGAADMEAFLNEPPRPGDSAGPPVMSLSLDLSAFEPPKAQHSAPAGPAPASLDVPSLSLDLSHVPAPALEALLPPVPLAFADIPALKLEDFFELQPVADLIHNEDTAPDFAPAPGGEPDRVITLGGDAPMPVAVAPPAAAQAPAFDGVPVLSLDLPELSAGIDLPTP